MAGNSGGPWGGGGNNGGGGDDDRDKRSGGRRPGDDGPQIPEIEELMKKGQEQLKVLMGGRGGGGGSQRGGGGQGGDGGPGLTRGTILLGVLAVAALWVYASFYTVKPEEQSVELFLGDYYSTGNPGLNFAPWPVVTAEVLPVTRWDSRSGGLPFRRSSLPFSRRVLREALSRSSPWRRAVWDPRCPGSR